MFDDNDDKTNKKTGEFPANIENLSVFEIEEYIDALHGEIKRCETDIKRKKASQDAAAAIFKS